jgi:phosphohistidine phosphatase
MTLRLMLLRHAKSSWTDPGRDDRDRPLSPRGAKAAPAMGRHMQREGLLPGLVLCSPARRARDTWRLVAEQLKSAPRVIVDEAVYDFGNGGRIVDAIRKEAGAVTSVLVAGHNPSLERLALRLTGEGSDKVRRRMERKFPTGALAVIDFAIDDWRELGSHPGTLVAFTRPKDLLS